MEFLLQQQGYSHREPSPQHDPRTVEGSQRTNSSPNCAKNCSDAHRRQKFLAALFDGPLEHRLIPDKADALANACWKHRGGVVTL